MIWGLWILPTELGHSFRIFLKGWVQPLMHSLIHSTNEYLVFCMTPGPVLGAEDTALNKTDNVFALPPFRKLAFECGHREQKTVLK